MGDAADDGGRGLERADVETKIQELYDVTLPEEYWSVDKSKANRAVKTVSTSSDDEASVEGEKPAPKKRGRPKKAASENGDEASVDHEKPAPKKRGRPKKVSVVSADDAEAGVAEVEAPESPKATDVDGELEEEPVQVAQDEPAPAEEEAVCSAGDESDDDLVSDSDSEDEEEEDSPPKPPAKAVEVKPPEAPVKTVTKKPVKKPAKKAAKKDGVPYTRPDGRRGLMWQGKECVIDEDEDNEVSEISNGLEKAIGYWNPDTKVVQVDPIE